MRVQANLWVGLVLAGVLSPVCLADSVVLHASRDATLYQDADGGFANGAGGNFFVGSISSGALRRSVIGFDVAGSVPAGATITSASLTLYMSRTSSGASAIGLYAAASDWNEGHSVAVGSGGAGATSQVGDVTWIHTFYATQFWHQPGGDFAPTASAERLVGGVGSYTWDSTAGTVADVQTWLDSPDQNFGWFLLGDEQNLQSAKRFESRESTTANLVPTLSITYTIPAPGSALSVGLLGGVLAVRRRR